MKPDKRVPGSRATRSEHWAELLRSLSPNKEGRIYTDIEGHFDRWHSGNVDEDTSVRLFVKRGIDNKYDDDFNEKEDWPMWDIVLSEDGTWHIA